VNNADNAGRNAGGSEKIVTKLDP